MSHNHQRKIAVINDFCGFGRCSIAASLPLISAMKIQCCPLPTSIFSNHTGFDSFFCTDYTKNMQAYAAEWKKLDLQFDGILTGFLASEQQLDIVIEFLSQFKTEKTITVVDPVMGDYGELYRTYSPKLADRMKQLVPFADILTPNLTEACILTGRAYKQDMTDDELLEICSELSALGPKKIVISGLNYGDFVKNYVFEQDKEPCDIMINKIGASCSGTGDVFSAIIAADAVNGLEFSDSVRHAARFIYKALIRTNELDVPSTDGICFEEILCEINGGFLP